MHLLIVDDDIVICRGLRQRVLSLGIDQIKEVLTAYSAEEALETTLAQPIDGVLTDIQMVDMDGLELIAEIRKHSPDMPCAIITAHDKFEYAQQAVRLGVEDFLLKPCTLEDMQAVVLKLLKRAQARREAWAEAHEGDRYEEWKSLRRHTDVDEKTDVIAWARKFARESIDKDVNMATVANELNMNYSYFSRLFKQQAGISFSAFMLEVKMQKAGEMLLKGFRVYEIAEKLGYSSAQNFNRAFVKYWRITPGQFVKRGV